MSIIYPTLREELFIYTRDNRVLYLFPDAPDWIAIKLKYKPIFDLFDGKNSIMEIEDYISKFYEDEEHILLPQIEELIVYSKIFKHNPADVYIGNCSKPQMVYLTLSDICNLNCAYCYAEERNKVPNTTLVEWCKYVDSVLEFTNECTFIFTGGEPLLVPYVYDLAEYIKKKKQKCILITNGTQIDSKEKALKVAECFEMIRISLDSIDEKISEQLRGKGTAAKVERAIELLETVNANYVIMATVCKLNKNDIDAFSHYFKDKVYFQPLYIMGRGREKEELSISGIEYYRALTNTSVFKYLRGYHNTINNFRNNPVKRCAMAREELSIAPNGDVFPCHMLHYEELRIGNLMKDALKEIYSSDKIEELRKVNVDNIPQCSNCIFRNFCGAACRARVDYFKNGIKGNNEFCDFEKAAILDALIYSCG